MPLEVHRGHEQPAGAPLHANVVMHGGAAQARTRLQERQRVSPAAQARDACDMMTAYVYYPT
jgi:hypothetical protein